MNLRIFVPTVGEDFTLETIRRIKKFTPEPYEMTVWYDTLGWPLDADFYEDLYALCKDVVLVRRNHGIINACNFAMATLDYDYLLIVLADNWLEKDFWDKLYTPHVAYPRVACTGGYRGPMEAPVIQAARGLPDTYPDGPLLISRAAFNDVGGISSSFSGHGHGFYEWHMRCQEKGWREFMVDGVFKEQGGWHDGRDKNSNANREIEASEKVIQRIRDKGFKGYDWWRSDL